MLRHKRHATRTQEHRREFRSGQGAIFSSYVVEGTWTWGSHSISKYIWNMHSLNNVYNSECIYYWVNYLLYYRSEGPAQVFLIVLIWLLSAIGHLPRRAWQNTIIAYDNMCHLDNLAVAKKPLPLPGPQKYIWKDVRKTIDCLHIRNHKDERCKVKYNPKDIKRENPDFNTNCSELTFAWL